MREKILYAEDLGHYWMTGKSSVDTWNAKTHKLIKSIGGFVTSEMIGTIDGKSAIMIAFKAEGNDFRIMEPVLPSKTGNILAAKRQAATIIFHEVKSLIVGVKVKGVTGAFAAHLVLPDGRVTWQAARQGDSQLIPVAFQLVAGE